MHDPLRRADSQRSSLAVKLLVLGLTAPAAQAAADGPSLPPTTRTNGTTEFVFRQNTVTGGGGVIAPSGGTAIIVGNRMVRETADAADSDSAFLDLSGAVRVHVVGNTVLQAGGTPNPTAPLIALRPRPNDGTSFNGADGLYDNTLATNQTFLRFADGTDAPGFTMLRNRLLGIGAVAVLVGGNLQIEARETWFGDPRGPGQPLSPTVDSALFSHQEHLTRMTPLDPDRDGLTIEEERHYGTTEAPPLAASDDEIALAQDTDGDRVDDGVEVALGTDPLVAEAHFGAALVDLDQDGLPDHVPALVYTSTIDADRLTADADRDGVHDAFELVTGTSPLDPSAGIVAGDINRDGQQESPAGLLRAQVVRGVMDAADLLTLHRWLGDSAAAPFVDPDRADLNRDGRVDEADPARLRLALLGLNPHLPTR